MLSSSLLCLSVSLAAAIIHGAPAGSNANTTWQLPPRRSFGTPGVNATYDYIVVGGGTAGLAVASRLSENSQLRIAVIEAGGFYEIDNGNFSTAPGYWPVGTETIANATISPVDWGFVTTPQAGANGRRLHYAAGKALGGSSARNAMLYHRPTVGTLQKWASLVDDDSFTFPRMLPFFRKSPHFNPPTLPYTNSTNEQELTAFSSSGGPLQVSFGAYVDPYASWVQYAFKALGQKLIRGLQSGNLIGQAYCPLTVTPVSVTRSSSEASFLQTAVRNTTLKVYNNTLAEKILFNKRNFATGVLVSSHGSSYVLTAKREVIISSGAFRSPQLLMVSGIGPSDQLKARRIPVIKDLPGVGQNLWDQPFIPTAHAINIPAASIATVISQYYQQGRGPLTVSTPGPLGWEKLPEPYRSNLTEASRNALDHAFPPDWPELEWLAGSAAPGPQATDFQVASIVTCLVAPLSLGNVSISTNSMADPPIINPNWLTHPADVELAVAAFKRQREYWRVLTAANLTIGEEVTPGPAVQTDEQILGYIRTILSPIWHAAGTCKMGTRNDTMAVVDSEFRVIGVEGLRVVDASIMPILVPGHPQGTIYAMAEKMADLILTDQ